MSGTRQTAIPPRRGAGGYVMVMALLILAVLFVLGSSFMTLMVGESQIATSDRDLTLALNAAEAGVQQALRNAKASASLTTLLADATANTGNNGSGTLQSNVTYAFTITNDPAENATPATDTNGTILITSTGRVRNATRIIEALAFVPKATFPSALHVPGTEGDSNFAGVSFTVDGYDTNPGTPSTAESRIPGGTRKLGVSAGSTSVRNDIYNALSSAERTRPVFDGLAGDYGGQPSLGVDTSLDSNAAQNLATAWAGFAPPQNVVDIGRTTLNVSGTHTYTNGSGGAPTASNNQAWGTPSQPGVFYVKGISAADYAANPTGVSGALSVSGNFEGAGILILDGADLSVSGNFRWEGIIIVTGPLVGFRIGGGGNQKVFGSVVVNERATDRCAVRADCNELILLGNAKLAYSQMAINNAMRALGQRFTYWNERGA